MSHPIREAAPSSVNSPRRGSLAADVPSRDLPALDPPALDSSAPGSPALDPPFGLPAPDSSALDSPSHDSPALDPPAVDSPEPRLAEFEELYRSQVAAVMAFFARRTRDPQVVADLTGDTFVEAMRSFATFDPVKGGERSWLFAIARHVYASYCEASSRRQAAALREGGRRALGEEEIDELLSRIGAEEPGRELLERLARLTVMDRATLELVDLVGLTPREAAAALGVSPGALRVRLFRVRARLRKEYGADA